MKKHLMKWMLGFFLACLVLLGNTSPVYAAGAQDAVKLTLNKVATDSLESGDDVNWYKFSITQRGYFKVAFNVDASSSSAKLGWG